MSVGGILGMPVLDVQPYGLGWRVCPTVHVFDALGVSLARGELAARERYHAALEQDRLELRQEQARRKSRRSREPDQSDDEINELSEKLQEFTGKVKKEEVPSFTFNWTKFER